METLKEMSDRTGINEVILERMYIDAQIDLVCALISYLIRGQDDERG